MKDAIVLSFCVGIGCACAIILLVAVCTVVGFYAGSYLSREVHDPDIEIATERSFSACVHNILTRAPANEAVFLQLGAHLSWFNENDQFRAVMNQTFGVGWPSGKNLATRARNISYGATALLVEPQPHVFSRLNVLTKGYQPSVQVQRAAVCDRSRGNTTFYSISPRVHIRDGAWLSLDTCHGRSLPCRNYTLRLQRWASQVASLDRNTVLRNLGRVPRSIKPLLEKYVVPVTVRCDTASRLLSRHGLSVQRVRVLSLDLEGTDTRIIGSVNLSKWDNLQVVVFEHKHSAPLPLCGALEKLHNAGFVCECEGENVRCIRPLKRRGQNVCSGLLPRRPDDPLASCVVGRNAEVLRGRCLHRPWWIFSTWRLRSG